MIQQGIDVVLYFDGKPLGGQQNVQFNRSAQAIDITNQINGDWAQSLSGVKTWSITCNGIYIVDSPSFTLLEDCFMNNKDITVELRINNKSYIGNAIITDFPMNSGYNNTFKYQVKLLGNGELRIV